jgi:prepilin-type N-terminal cleavage/methylation domain-containing protein
MTRFNPPNLLRRGFSLVEILFAIFILGIGLLMIAAVFPVAIKWTNQDVQSTIGLVISRSAVAQIKAAGLTGFGPMMVPGYSFNADITMPQPYRYGTPNPTPSVGIVQPAYGYTNNDLKASYWWQAVAVPVNPSVGQGVAYTPNAPASTTYQVYIFVFSKGNVNNTYPENNQLWVRPNTPTPGTIVAPSLYRTVLHFVPDDNAMPTGSIGLDLDTGAVVRKEIINPPGTGTPYLGLSENVNTSNADDLIVYAPPADNQEKSPLVYIYATTVTF